MKPGTLVLAAATVAGLGAVVGTVFVGSMVKEETIVSNPYEEGLRQDADRRARAALGWDVRLPPPPAAPGAVALAFEVVDRDGRPLEGADVAVFAHRPDTSRGAVSRDARPAGGGRFSVDLDLPAPGAWLLRFDVRRGVDRVQVERTITVGGASPPLPPSPRPSPPAGAGGEGGVTPDATSNPNSPSLPPSPRPSPPAGAGGEGGVAPAAADSTPVRPERSEAASAAERSRRGSPPLPPSPRPSPPADAGGEGGVAPAASACDLGAGPCTLPLDGGGEVALELGPHPLRTMRDLSVAVELRGVRAEGAEVKVSFAMRGMDMGPNESALAPAGPGRFAGRAVLVRCPSGRKDWIAEVAVARPGEPPRLARFELAVAE